MATATGYRGEITVDTTNVLDFIGAWTVTIEREVSEGKPPITAASTGAKPKAPGALSVSGSLSGLVMAGANTGRAYLMTKLKAGTKVTLDLEQTDGASFALTGVLLTNCEWNTDSEETPTVDFEFEADDYTYDDNSAGA